MASQVVNPYFDASSKLQVWRRETKENRVLVQVQRVHNEQYHVLFVPVRLIPINTDSSVAQSQEVNKWRETKE